MLCLTGFGLFPTPNLFLLPWFTYSDWLLVIVASRRLLGFGALNSVGTYRYNLVVIRIKSNGLNMATESPKCFFCAIWEKYGHSEIFITETKYVGGWLALLTSNYLMEHKLLSYSFTVSISNSKNGLEKLPRQSRSVEGGFCMGFDVSKKRMKWNKAQSARVRFQQNPLLASSPCPDFQRSPGKQPGLPGVHLAHLRFFHVNSNPKQSNLSLFQFVIYVGVRKEC